MARKHVSPFPHRRRSAEDEGADRDDSSDGDSSPTKQLRFEQSTASAHLREAVDMAPRVVRSSMRGPKTYDVEESAKLLARVPGRKLKKPETVGVRAVTMGTRPNRSIYDFEEEETAAVTNRQNDGRNAPWTDEDRALLQQLRDEGMHYRDAARLHFPHRTENTVKTQWYQHIVSSEPLPAVIREAMELFAQVGPADVQIRAKETEPETLSRAQVPNGGHVKTKATSPKGMVKSGRSGKAIPYTEEEDQRILANWGQPWEEFLPLFPNRTQGALNSRHSILLRHPDVIARKRKFLLARELETRADVLPEQDPIADGTATAVGAPTTNTPNSHTRNLDPWTDAEDLELITGWNDGLAALLLSFPNRDENALRKRHARLSKDPSMKEKILILADLARRESEPFVEASAPAESVDTIRRQEQSNKRQRTRLEGETVAGAEEDRPRKRGRPSKKSTARPEIEPATAGTTDINTGEQPVLPSGRPIPMRGRSRKALGRSMRDAQPASNPARRPTTLDTPARAIPQPRLAQAIAQGTFENGDEVIQTTETRATAADLDGVHVDSPEEDDEEGEETIYPDPDEDVMEAAETSSIAGNLPDVQDDDYYGQIRVLKGVLKHAVRLQTENTTKFANRFAEGAELNCVKTIRLAKDKIRARYTELTITDEPGAIRAAIDQALEVLSEKTDQINPDIIENRRERRKMPYQVNLYVFRDLLSILSSALACRKPAEESGEVTKLWELNGWITIIQMIVRLYDRSLRWKTKVNPDMLAVKSLRTRMLVPLRDVLKAFKQEARTLEKSQKVAERDETFVATQQQKAQTEERRNRDRVFAPILERLHHIFLLRTVVEPNLEYRRGFLACPPFRQKWNARQRNIEEGELDATGEPIERVSIFGSRPPGSLPPGPTILDREEVSEWTDRQINAFLGRHGLEECARRTERNRDGSLKSLWQKIFERFCKPYSILRGKSAWDIMLKVEEFREAEMEPPDEFANEVCPDWVVDLPDMDLLEHL